MTMLIRNLVRRARNRLKPVPHRQNTKVAIQRLLDLGIPVANVLDVGVLHGTKTLQELFASTHHHLFEPEAAHFKTIRQNYAAIPHTLHEVAASDADDVAFLESRSIDGSGNVTHSHVASEGSEIRRAKLDTIARDILGPFMLKIDVDGHEMSVLRGACETLKRSSIVMIEAPVHGTPIPLVERTQYLADRGFIMTDIADPMYYDRVLWQVDLIFVHQCYADRHVELRPFQYERGFVFNQFKIS